MELHHRDAGRNDARPHANRSTILYGQRKRLKNIFNTSSHTGFLPARRRPIFWSLFSRSGKRLWLLQKRRQAERTYPPG